MHFGPRHLFRLHEIFADRETLFWVENPLDVYGDFERQWTRNEHDCRRLLLGLVAQIDPDASLCHSPVYARGGFLTHLHDDHVHVREWGLTVGLEAAEKILVLGLP